MSKNPLKQLSYLRADIRRWQYASIKEAFYIIFEPGLWAVIIYRFGRFLFLIDIPVVKIFIRFIAYLMMKVSEILFGVSIKAGTDIGPGLFIGHTGAVIVHPNAQIGENLSIGTGVIIGERGLGKGGYPIIGNDVYVGVGAKILGNIKIGNKVKIGANAVVVKDIPDGSTAVGVPARIIHEVKE